MATISTCTRNPLPVLSVMWQKEPTTLSHFRELSVGALFTGNDWGIVGDAMTVVANLLATALITYKAWSAVFPCALFFPRLRPSGNREHRRSVHGHLQFGAHRSRGSKVLVLLVESGVAYGIIWVPTTVFILKILLLTVLMADLRPHLPDHVS